MEHTVDKYESDAHMAVRLMRTLHSREEARSQKKRYMLERWPEKAVKYRKLENPSARYMSEMDLRDDKTIASVRKFMEDSVTRNIGSTASPDISLSKILDLPDSDLLKMCPVLLSSLNLLSLRKILAALTGNPVAASQKRCFIEHKIKIELAAEAVLASPEHSKQVSVAAKLLRSPSSYGCWYQFPRLKIKPFSKMPPSIVDAASETFRHVDKFPTCVISELNKLLSTSNHSVKNLLSQSSHESMNSQSVHRNFKGLLGNLKEGKPLPPCLEKALWLISLSARISYGDDGNLRDLLSPLSPKQCYLEEIYESAFLRLKDMNTADLWKIYDTIGLDQPRNIKSICIYRIQAWLFASVHCIYDGIDLPDDILTALSMINDVPKIEEGGAPEEYRTKMMERIEAVLDLSAEFRNLLWEFHEALQEHNTGPSTNEVHTNSGKNNLNHSLEEMEIEENLGLQKATECGIEEFSDEVAKATYLLIGCLFQRVSKQFPDAVSQDRIVLEIARNINIISESVLQEVEIRLNTIGEVNAK